MFIVPLCVCVFAQVMFRGEKHEFSLIDRTGKISACVPVLHLKPNCLSQENVLLLRNSVMLLHI